MKKSTKRVAAYTFLTLFLLSLFALGFAVFSNNKQVATETTTTQTVGPPFTAPAKKLKITADQVMSWENIRVLFVDPQSNLHVFKNVLELPFTGSDPISPDSVVSINYVDENGVVYEGIKVTREKIRIRTSEDHVGYPTVSMILAKSNDASVNAELDQYVDMIYIDLEK